MEITTFVRLCGESIVGLKISDISHVSDVRIIDQHPLNPPLLPQVVQAIDNFMLDAAGWIAEYPPIQQPMRFGNKAYRLWHERLQTSIEPFLLTILAENQHQYIPELKAYLSDSFGNDRRIDYGTGHETNLALFYLCLMKLRIITEADLPALILKSFVTYIKTMRSLQSTYYLEPAGSHGVWGLDDYHCLIYVWGSFQVSLVLAVLVWSHALSLL